MKILVTGAAGFIGSRFCEMARARGHFVRALMRPRPGPISYPPADEVVYGNFPYAIPERAVAGIETAVHCAGATTGQDDAESEAINVEGTRFLLKLASRAGCGRIVFLSSQSAHENAISAYGKTKLRAEQVLRAGDLPFAILRPGLVFGPGTKGLYHRTMRQLVHKLPFLPLLGGGKATLQPIEVSDLCRAMLACAELRDTESLELNLGEPEPLTLREFLQRVAVAETGRRKFAVSIPVWPILSGVVVAEKLGIRLPVSSDNLRAVKVVQRMETRDSLKRIGVELAPLEEALKRSAGKVDSDHGCEHEQVRTKGSKVPVRVMLVGAGKVGIVHALNLTQREGATLACIVDPNSKAFRLYRAMGFTAPCETSLSAAIETHRPHAAIIATPARLHVSIARECLGRGIHVLSEKPIGVTPAQRTEFTDLSCSQPTQICHAGYMAAQYPHLDPAREVLAGGQIGAIRGVYAYCLQTHIVAAKPVRWEMIREQSGGGVMINFASHVLTILIRLLGEPDSAAGEIWPIYSTEVEDAADVMLVYPKFRARLLASWSIPGFARPMNRMVIAGETGELVIENYYSALIRDGRVVKIWTQKDFSIGYNAAPDYTGGGFAMEHDNFARTVFSGAEADSSLSHTPVTIQEAAVVEGLINRIYEGAEKSEVSKFGSEPLRVLAAEDALTNRYLGMLRK